MYYVKCDSAVIRMQMPLTLHHARRSLSKKILLLTRLSSLPEGTWKVLINVMSCVNRMGCYKGRCLKQRKGCNGQKQ